MHELIAKDPRNAERIFPYIGGEEVNDSPTHAHHRYVINFGEMTEDEARRWPDLMTIVEAKVKPERDAARQRETRSREELVAVRRDTRRRSIDAIRGLERVLVISHVSATRCVSRSCRRAWSSRTRSIVFAVRRPTPPSASSSPASTKSGRASSARR